MKNKEALSALAMDLKRLALGLHRGSFATAKTFTEEAGKRIEEVDQTSLLPYMKHVLSNIQSTLANKNSNKKAEDALMYSTIVQNYVLYK